MRKKALIRAAMLFAAFVLFTVLVRVVDVRPIGPEGSEVGFSALNLFVFRLFGVHTVWYHVTDWLGVAAILTAFAFALTGLCRLVKRKSLRKVDRPILALGGCYLLVIACYAFFERVVINCRPVILGQGPEASYPSSHTMIVVCIMATAAIAFRELHPEKKRLCRGVEVLSALLMAVTVAGRLISGVHWFTDIVGGLLLSSALVELYRGSK